MGENQQLTVTKVSGAHTKDSIQQQQQQQRQRLESREWSACCLIYFPAIVAKHRQRAAAIKLSLL
jgi:hypothetical protein